MANRRSDPDPQDRDDLARLVDGDKAAWDRFVARYAGVVFAAVQRRLVPAGRAEEVEDVVQDVFVRLCARGFRLLRTYDPARARMSTWLSVVAISTAIDHLRRRRGFNQPLDTVPETDLAVPAKEPAERIAIPDGLLSPRQAVILEMLYQREMDVAEVAQALDINPQTVRSMHHKALTRLRAHFRTDDGSS